MLVPKIAGERASWDEALDLVASRFSAAITAHGPNSVAFYVSGQLLTEDYYVANKLMKGFIGSGNIDTNSRLCMSSSVAGHKRAFGSDTVPGTYEDLELADLVILVGSNLAWCHPVLYQRLLAAKEQRGTQIVVIDPRATATSEAADLHLALAPGSDVALFNGLLAELVASETLDRSYVDGCTVGFDDAVKTARRIKRGEVQLLTGLSADEIEDFYDLFVATDRVVTVYSQGVNQSGAGTDKVNAIINCHLATGRIGRPGTGPFSVTGQPNAMGGREVGGLANMLACHMELENSQHRHIVRSFWKSPTIASNPGLKAVDLMRAVDDGRIKALWIMGTNPVDSLPDANFVRSALRKCPFVVVSEVIADTDTTPIAQVLLPALAWGEKDGTVTNSERRISRQRPFLEAPGEARSDWWQMAEVGKRLGYSEAFSFADSAAVFSEYAELSGTDNNGTRDFDISAYAGISTKDYDALQPFQWPQPKGSARAESRFFANGGFFTGDRRGRFIATPFRGLAAPTDDRYPYVLNTGRIRDQWHTMTRTGKTARLTSHIAEPFVEISPDDASAVGLHEASLAELASPYGRIIVRTLITERQRCGSVFVPMHWTDQFASNARVDSLVAPNADPISGQPELKAAPVSVHPFKAAWYGFAVLRSRPARIETDYWAIAPTKTGWRIELASRHERDDWDGFARQLIAMSDPEAEVLSYHDYKSGQFRFAAFNEQSLIGALYVSRQPVAVSRNFASDTLAAVWPDKQARIRILAGKAPTNIRDRGATVCSCFEVGLNDIVDAVISSKCMTVEAVGQALKAGTNCGSCRPEIKRIIQEQTVAKVI